MQKLTIENAPNLLGVGETYRLGYNAANCGEVFLCFDRIEAQDDQILGTVKHLFGYWGFDERELLDCVANDDVHYRAYEFDNDYCSGSGAEPLWILEDGESCEDIRDDKVDYGDEEEDDWG